MQRQWVFGAIIVLVAIAGFVLFLRGGRKAEESSVGEPAKEEVEEVVSGLSEQMGVTIPEDVERVALRDVTGGSASGLATRKFDETGFSHTLLAALPDPASGSFYEGWMVRGKEGDEDFSVIRSGRLRSSKGGFLLEFSTDRDLTDHPTVVVTEERVDDGKPEDHLLEGSF